MAVLKRVFPFARPFLKVLGADVEKMAEALAKVDDLLCQTEELSRMPDQFNDIFGERGWIMYGAMNLEVAKRAVEKAKSGDIDGAEDDLVSHYDAETVKWHLSRMWGVRAFRPRMRLAEKAFTDHAEGRYHACVPVVLALMDGLVNELHPNHRGFFANGTELAAWDSIAAHSRGLGILVRLFQKGQYKTTTEEMRIPYRNGIMHGMALGYDNRMVAAKAWAALFAVREWALKVEHGDINAPAEQSQPTFADLAKQLTELDLQEKRLAEWKPRGIQVGVNVPESGEPAQYVPGTPEEKLARYLGCWARSNYGRMAECLPHDTRKLKGAPQQVREVFEGQRLKAFRFVGQ